MIKFLLSVFVVQILCLKLLLGNNFVATPHCNFNLLVLMKNCRISSQLKYFLLKKLLSLTCTQTHSFAATLAKLSKNLTRDLLEPVLNLNFCAVWNIVEDNVSSPSVPTPYGVQSLLIFPIRFCYGSCKIMLIAFLPFLLFWTFLY